MIRNGNVARTTGFSPQNVNNQTVEVRALLRGNNILLTNKRAERRSRRRGG